MTSSDAGVDASGTDATVSDASATDSGLAMDGSSRADAALADGSTADSATPPGVLSGDGACACRISAAPARAPRGAVLGAIVALGAVVLGRRRRSCEARSVR